MQKLGKLSIVAAVILFVQMGATAMGAPIPREIKSTVVFVYIEKDSRHIPNGTGFCVAVKHPTDPNRSAPYLATAKHVLCKPDSSDLYDKVTLRLNKKAGGSDVGSIPLVAGGAGKNVFTHPDPNVDLGVIPFAPTSDIYDIQFLPHDMITTQAMYQDLNIREGSDVFFTGLFAPYPGAEKNYPVVRFGRVALVTEEMIPWANKTKMHLYLIEAGSYGGNSGSPVFFYLGADREPGSLVVGQPVLKLAGVMLGTYLDAHPLAIKVIETEKKTIPLAHSSMGIAAVTPGYKLHEILFGEELKTLRGW